MQGSIPSTIGMLLAIQTGIFLQNNRFSGPLPPELGRLSGVIRFDAENNYFDGQVPDFFGWNVIQSFRVKGNLLTGTFPSRFCSVIEVNTATATADCDEIICNCCTECEY